MKIEPNQSVVIPLTNNLVQNNGAQPIFKGISCRLIKQEIDTFVLLNKGKAETVNIKNAADNILQKIGLKRDLSVPEVKNKLIAEVFEGLQNEKDFFNDYAKSGYKSQNIRNNAKLISSLEDKKIIKEQMPWESPRFENGQLSDSAYKDIRQKIIDAPSWKMSDYEKKEALNSLARDNGHSGDIIYGNPSFYGQSVEHSNISEYVDEDTHEGFLETILDILDDLF